MPILPQIAHLFNRIYLEGTIPSSWKSATVVPIFKGGDKSCISNYRPISLLPVIVKILEKTLHYRLYTYLNANNFFTESQGGFRPWV